MSNSYSNSTKATFIVLMLLSFVLIAIPAVAVDVKVEITSFPTNFTPGDTQATDYVFKISKFDSTNTDSITGITVNFGSNFINNISGLSWTCAATPNSSCATQSGVTSTLTVIDLVGMAAEVTFTLSNVAFNPNIFTDIDFAVDINANFNGNTDNNATNDTASEILIRQSQTDIIITVDDSSSIYTPGIMGINYVVNIRNTGPSDAQNVQFSDTVLSGFLITNWSCAANSGSSCSVSGASNDDVNPMLDIVSVNSDTIIINITVDYASSTTADPMEYTVHATSTDPQAINTNGTTVSAIDSNSLNLISDLEITVDTLNSAHTDYTPGSNETYVVVVTNNGPSDVTGVTVVDNNLNDFANISWSCIADNGSSCTSPPPNRLNTTANIEAGDSVTYTVNVTFKADLEDPVTYTVTASNPAGVIGIPVSDSKILSLGEKEANLRLTLDDMANTYTPGTSSTFTAVLTNDGPSDVSGISIIDTNIAEFANISWTCSLNTGSSTNSNCVNGTGNINTTVDLAANDSATFTISVDYDSSATTNPLVYSLTATNPAGVTGTPPVTADDDDNELRRQVNLAITKTGPPGVLTPNQSFTYTIIVANTGPSDLGKPAVIQQPPIAAIAGVNLTDNMDLALLNHLTECISTDNKPCWEYCSTDDGVNDSVLAPVAAACPNGEIVQDFGNNLAFGLHLSSGSSTEIRVHTRLNNGATFGDCITGDSEPFSVCNTATIDFTQANMSDITIANIGSTLPLSATTENVIVIGTDIAVTKTDNVDNIASGTQNSYTITVANNGSINATGISVEDLMPLYPATSAGFVAGSISWTCATSDTGACCNTQSTACGLNSPTASVVADNLNTLIDLDGGAALTFTITGDIAQDATGILSNTASATLNPNSNIVETNPANNSAIDTTNLTETADIAVIKSLESAEINPIDDSITDLTYKILVSNLGASNASTVIVADSLNSLKLDLSTASWTCSINGTGGSSCAVSGSVLGAINTTVALDVGDTATFIITISTNANAQGKVLNTATVSVPNPAIDPVLINNSSTVEYSLTGTAQLTIDNDDGLLNATPGLTTGYTIRVTNQGPDDVFAANIQNFFPAQLTDVEWTCDAVSPIPGDLAFLQRSDQSAVGTHMVSSPNNQFIYITSTNSNNPVGEKIYIFKREINPGSSFGQLQFSQAITQDDSGVDVLADALAISISQSGQHLYVLSGAVPAIAIFSRDAITGNLTYQGKMDSNIPVNPVAMLLNNDQQHLYVTGNNAIQVYARDVASGLLTHMHTVSQVDAGVIIQNNDGTQIYVIATIGSTVNAYNKNANGNLTSFGNISNADINTVSDALISADGKTIYLTAAGTGKIVLLNRDISSGAISFNLAYDDSLLNPGETLAGLLSMAISADNQHVFVSNPIQNSLLVLSRNNQGLLFRKGLLSISGLEGISDLLVTNDGKHVLTTATASLGKTLTSFSRRQPDPIFSFIEAEFDGVNDLGDTGGMVDGLLDASALTISNDGKHVYVAGLADNSVVVFQRNKRKGATAATKNEHLSYITHYTDGIGGVSGITDVDAIIITPNGNYLYVASSNQASLTVFARQADGTLSYITSYQHLSNQTDGLLGINGMVIDASSQHLYTAARFEAAVAHYTIQADGSLILVDAVANGDIGVSGLAGARALAISPDGKHIVAANSIDDSVVVLARDSITGNINFLQHVVGVGNQPMDISISPDGEHVYVVAANDSRLTVLKRNANASSTAFGRLSPLTSYSDGVAGFNLLAGARTVAISNDGDKVYVGAEFDHSISVMTRDKNPNSSSFGHLTLVNTAQDDSAGVDGLRQIYDLVVSSDSKHVYAAGFADNALTAFILGSGSQCSAQGTGNINDTVDIGSNGTLTYNVTAKIKSSATGLLQTEASIIAPNNFTVINPVTNCSIALADNCDSDSTSLIPVNDLAITKTDNRLSTIAGQPVQYEIVVSNNGPSDATSNNDTIIMVRDILGSDFNPNLTSWTCAATGSGALSYIQSIVNEANNIVGLQGISSLTISADLASLGSHVLATSVLDGDLLAFAINPLTGELSPPVHANTGGNLSGARDVIVIDNDIYVASQFDDSLVAFKAVDNTGLELQLLANYNFSTGINGLNQAVAVIAADDGSTIYVAGANDNSVVVFNRDLITGLLTLASTNIEGVNGSLGLAGINALAISSDGYSVYTSGLNTSSLGIYKRDLISGTLTFVELKDTSNAGVDMAGISAIDVSADGEHVYVTSATNNAVYVFKRKTDVSPTDLSYGTLTFQQEIHHGINNVNGLLAPADITISADARHVYVSSEQSDAVVWFARNLETGDLTFAGLVSNLLANVNGLDGAIAVAVDNTGNYVYVAGSLDNAISVFSRSDDSFCPAGGTGDIAVDTGFDILGVPVDIAVNGSLVFTVNTTVATNATGTLVNTAEVFNCTQGGPLNIQATGFCQDDIDSDLSNNSATDTDLLNPTADLVITKSDGISQFDGLLGAIKVTGNNDYIYVAAKNDNAISIWARESNVTQADYGQLNYISSVVNAVAGVSGLLGIADIILSADGLTVYAAGSSNNAIVVFRRNISDGSLEFLEKHTSGVFGVVGIEGVKALTLSDDGEHLYATGPLTNSLVMFNIENDAGSNHGRLSFAQHLQNGVNTVAGLVAISDVAVAQDGKHVYVTSQIDNSISVFLRNPNSASLSFGELSYLTTYTNGVNGIAGIAGAVALTITTSNGGDYIYVLGAADQALAVFNRDDVTGELTFIEFKQNGTSGVEGLDFATDLILNPDGSTLYVAGANENTLVQFNRNQADGTLAFAAAIHDGDALPQAGESIDGLAGVAGLFVTADDAHIYAVAADDNSVAVFNTSTLEFLQIAIDQQGGISPGTEISYIITVNNNGPSDVAGAVITDIFPAEFEQISYQCSPTAGAACSPVTATGNVNVIADLAVGSSVHIVATGMIKSDATGTLINTASVTSSTDPTLIFTDPDINNNTATDDDTVLFPAVNLVVTKTNGLTEVIPGETVTYDITVANNAPLAGNNIPADISSVFVTDTLPESMVNVSWTCQASPQPGLFDTTAVINYNDLAQHQQMVISQNGAFAYVIGSTIAGVDTIIVYARNLRTGELLETQRLSNGTDGVVGLLAGSDLVISNDGKNLYVTAAGNDALLSFTIDTVTGVLSYIDTFIDGLNGVNGLGGAQKVILSTDSRHVYVAGKLDNAIAIFDRNLTTGTLNYTNLLTGAEGLTGVQSMVFDSTGQYLLVIADANESLASFVRNTSTGLLTPADDIQDFELSGSVLQQPEDIVVHGTNIIVASFISDAISVFTLDTSNGDLIFQQVIRHNDTGVTAMQGPVSLVLGDTGRELYVASNISQSITLFDFDNASLTPLNVVYASNIIAGLDNLGTIITNPASDFIYALSDDLLLTAILNGSHCSDNGTGHLTDEGSISSGGHLQYTVTGDVLPTATGTLTNTATALAGAGFVEIFPLDNSATDSDILTPVADLSVSKTDNLTHVVAGTTLTYEISAFSAGPSTVSAEIMDDLPIFPTVTAGLDANSISWQCATNKTLQFNAEYVDDTSNGLQDVSAVIVTSDGLYAYATSPTTGSVAIFNRNISGELTFNSLVSENDVLAGGTVVGLLGASSINFDHTGEYVYITGETANTIVAFKQDNSTGLLDYVQTIATGADGVIGLTGPVNIAITPDNAGLYVAAKGSDAITVFSRNIDTGELTFVERVRDGFGTIVPESNVIIGISDLVFSADSQYLYTVADFSDAITVFARDEATQILNFVEVIRTGDDHNGTAVAGMNGIQSIAITPNGNFVYTVATLDSSILTFARDITAGTLLYQDVLQHGDVGSGSIAEPTSIVISPNGDRIIVADAASHAINIYDRNLANGSIELLDTFSNSIDGSSLLLAPKTMITDGVNIIVVAPAASSLVALRITAHAECLQRTVNTNLISAALFMNPGSAGGVTIQALVHPAARGIINNTAIISPLFGTGDNIPANNTALDQTQITIETDVAMVKTAPSDAISGTAIQYSLLLTNSGPSDALGVMVQDTLDPAIINATWTCNATGRSSCTNQTGVDDVDTLVNIGIDGRVAIIISATISPAFAGVLTNTANTIVIEEGNITDTDLTNNSSSTTTAVTRVADIQVSKSNFLSEVVAGEIINYEIVVTNNGPSDAPNTLVSDLLPASLTNISWVCITSTPSLCNTSGASNLHEFVDLSTSEPITFQLQGKLATGATGMLTNTVTVAVAPEIMEPDTSNNMAVDTDAIIQIADMEIILIQQLNPYDPASHVPLPVVLKVINHGPSDADNVLVNFDLDAAVNVQTTGGCSLVVASVVCDLGYTVANQSIDIPINFEVMETPPVQRTSTAAVATTTFDPDLSNNLVSEPIDFLTGIDIRVNNSDGRTVVGPGQVLRYLITLENVGSIDAGDMDIIETLPAELVSASWTCQAFNGATCLNIDEFGITGSANIPATGRVELRLITTVDPTLIPDIGTPITNTVEVNLVTGTDFNLLNNTAADTDIIISVIFVDDFE